ncbi:RlpA-like double-psi beta-barrel-protein domain-containing protein-containing protein [Tricladium varicosporioides]|nr:RlpA-like double-psi beta-barrel-protein domain-containing protein-containing protein [Hymenoscyphus varicosporioides]
MHFSSTVAASAFLTLANAAVMGKRALSGEATYYGGNVAGGTCSFSTYTLPSGIYGTALSDANWANSGNCGACVSVTGPSGNSITAMIVDQCPGCGTNHLDLFPDAFSALADPTKGIIDVAWSIVDCPITTPLQLHNKEGVSAYWFSMQVVNANKAVASLEVSTDGGNTWQGTTRQTYNFFENSAGFGTTTVDVKVTSTGGDSVVVKNVNVASGESTTAGSNFGGSSSGTASSVVPVAASSSVAAVASSTPAVASSPVLVPTSSPVEALATSTAASKTSAAMPVWTPKASTAAEEEEDACAL